MAVGAERKRGADQQDALQLAALLGAKNQGGRGGGGGANISNGAGGSEGSTDKEKKLKNLRKVVCVCVCLCVHNESVHNVM